jgi:homoserine dehydrogenase
VRITSDWKQVVRDPEVEIVVELVGVLPTARAIAFAALDAGKHLVTANKQVVAEYGVELVERSRARHVGLGIEACVAGGMPVLHAVREGLAGENFTAVYGILNGTTNYILTEMESRGCSFAEALAEAQQKGYAEPDPTFDVEGYDARYKIAILAMMCFGQAVRVREIPVEGITRIEQVDLAYARGLNHTLRLIAGATRRASDRLEIFVRPMMIPAASHLASVLGATNGVLLVGNKGGNTSITGRGAGGEPTGVAVLSDVVQIARSITAGRSPSTPFGYESWHPSRMAAPDENVVASYLRLVVHHPRTAPHQHRLRFAGTRQHQEAPALRHDHGAHPGEARGPRRPGDRPPALLGRAPAAPALRRVALTHARSPFTAGSWRRGACASPCTGEPRAHAAQECAVVVCFRLPDRLSRASDRSLQRSAWRYWR